MKEKYLWAHKVCKRSPNWSTHFYFNSSVVFTVTEIQSIPSDTTIYCHTTVRYMFRLIRTFIRHLYYRSFKNISTFATCKLFLPVAARLLRWWVRIPPGAGMSVCCECCMLSGRGLCDELITRPEMSYEVWCVVVCDLETSWMRRPWPTGGPGGGLSRQKQINSSLERSH